MCTLTANKTKLDEFSMVFLNNLLSLPLILLLMYYYGELPAVFSDPALQVVPEALKIPHNLSFDVPRAVS